MGTHPIRGPREIPPPVRAAAPGRGPLPYGAPGRAPHGRPPAAPRSGRAPEPTSHRDTPAGPRSRRGRGGAVGASGPKGARQGEGPSERAPRRPPEPGHHGPLPPLGHVAMEVAPIRERGAPQPWRFGARATGSTGDWEHRRLGARSTGSTVDWEHGCFRTRASQVALPDEAARPRPCGSPPNPWPPSRGGRRSLTETQGCAHPTVDAPRPGETAGFRPSEGPTPSHFARSASLQGRPSGRFATGSSFTLRPP